MSNRMDLTLEESENSFFTLSYHSVLRKLKGRTQFTKRELSCILMVYHKFALRNGSSSRTMTKLQFKQLLLVFFNIYDTAITARITAYLGNYQSVNFFPHSWVKFFSIFMSTKLDVRMKFCFDIYNIYDEVGLSREVVTRAVDKFFTGDDEDEVQEMRQDMVETILAKFDPDRDSVITFEKYAAVVGKEPLMMEFLGNCLPSYETTSVMVYCANIVSKLNC